MFGSFQYSNIESMDKKNVDGLHIDYYPLFFDQDTANRITRSLESIEYLPTFFKEADKKLQLCTRGAAWFVDYGTHKSARDWVYTKCENHVNGLPAIELTGALRDLRNLISKFTGQEYNAVLVRQLKHGEDCTPWDTNSDPWLGDTFDTPCLSFGSTRLLQFRKHYQCVPPIIHAKDNKKQIEDKHVIKLKNQKASQKQYRLDNGSLIIMKNPSHRLWQQRIAYDEDCCEPSYHIVFRNVNPTLIHKQYEKYPRIIDRRPPYMLEQQWRSDQRITVKETERIDRAVYNKTDAAKAEKAGKTVKNESEQSATGLLDSIGNSLSGTWNWLSGSPISKPPHALRKPSGPPTTNEPRPPPRPMSITDQVQRSQRQGDVQHPIRTVTAEDLERQIKEQTGRDIHIPYKGRVSDQNRKKSKTVVVDLSETPETPVVSDIVNTDDQAQSIKRIYTHLLPLKEIDPTLFDREMQKASETIKGVSTKQELINTESVMMRRLIDLKREAIQHIKEDGLISEKEAREWLD